MDFLFGCAQCRPPTQTDPLALATELWLLATLAVVLIGLWARHRPR